MDRLISERAVLGVINEAIRTGRFYYGKNQTIKEIKDIPSAQPKTGHWKAKSFHELFCDNCGFDFDIMRNDFIDKMNYCPNCGARMVETQGSEVEE